MNFGSDNNSGVHPRVMAALAAANDGAAGSYGRDALTEAAADRVREVFEAPDAAVFFVATGTGANALALAQLCPPWGRIFCHQTAHIETSESGGPSWMAGGALLGLTAGPWGRMTPQTLAARIADYPQVDEHDGRNAVLSITNATEWGTVHDVGSVAALSDVARASGMAVHMDGARFANAAATTGASPADLSWRVGVDVLTLGGTKCGCLALEAVIFFDPDRARDFAFRRMRAGHLWSKHRFLAAQALAWLDGGLWLDLARHANAAAADLAAGLRRAGFEPLAPVEANEVFVRLPRTEIARLRTAGLRAADWPEAGDDQDSGTIRLVTGWTTTNAEIGSLVSNIEEIS